MLRLAQLLFAADGYDGQAIAHTWPIPEKYHYNTWIAERTNALIEQYNDNDEPFLLWASFFDPHPDYLVPEPWASMYDPDKLTLPEAVSGEHDNNPPHFRLTQETAPDFAPWKESGFAIHGYHSHQRYSAQEQRRNMATYYGMVSMMDKYIGRVLDKLDELGLTDNTVVVFTTDHGHFFGHHGLHFKGGFHYEDLIKLPFIVRYPDRVPAGRSSAAMQSLVDLAPTFLSLAGIPVPRAMTGVDQVRYGLANKAPRGTMYCANSIMNRQRSIRKRM